MIAELLQFVAGLLILLGSLFALLAGIGIVRLPDLYTRMHAASKAGAVGAGLLLAAIAIMSLDPAIVLRAIAGFCFILLTTPVSAHLLARAALLTGHKPVEGTVVEGYDNIDSNSV